MNFYTYPNQQDWPGLIKRPVTDFAGLEKPVRNILRKVKKNGDKAVIKFTKELDGVKLTALRVAPSVLMNAGTQLSDELKEAIQTAKANIETFHTAQQQPIQKIETMPGVVCWRKAVGIERVGLYIPGGSAPLFSTVLMLAIPAKLAGCKEIVLCSPPAKDGSINPAILFAAQLCGVTEVYRAGGVQAIGAMAYGTASIPKVMKIFGPGNQYVTLAKQFIQQEGVAIDMPAGPSEVVVIADETADPDFVAADLLAQAEHGPDSQVMLISTSEELAVNVKEAINTQLPLLPRKAIAQKALQNSRGIIVKNIEEAVALSDRYAPEHLIIACKNAAVVAEKINVAGSVFIGHYSPESAGDYASGTNHTLPTNGYAASYSGVSLDSFMNKITFQELSKEGLGNIAPAVITMAASEGLEAHKRAVEIRLNK